MMLGLNQIMILNGGQSRSITGENKEGKKEPEDRRQEIWEREEKVHPVHHFLWEKLQSWQILKVLEPFSIFFYGNK